MTNRLTRKIWIGIWIIVGLWWGFVAVGFCFTNMGRANGAMGCLCASLSAFNLLIKEMFNDQ